MNNAQLVRGILGAYCADQEPIEGIHARLRQTRPTGVVRVTRDRAARRSTAQVPSPSTDRSPSVLISGPHITRSDIGEPDDWSTHVIVCFDGHLIEPVPGIDISVRNPAEIARQAYWKWGAGCLGHFSGNYTVAVFDARIPRLFVARDATGTKPLFFAFDDNLVFGSSANEVRRVAGLRAVADARGIFRYLSEGAIAGTAYTMLEHVQSLTRGAMLSAAPGRPPELLPVTAKDDAPGSAPSSFDETSNALRALMLDTVRLQANDECTGVPLSGGIDSSGLVACLRKARGPRAPIHAFTFVHTHPALPKAWDELPWAQMAARHAGATLHAVRLQASAIPGMMARIFQSQDFPFGSPVVFAHAEVCRVAADAGMQVMLSGHGPDVIFGGGVSHIVQRASTLLQQGRVSDAWRFVQAASGYAAARPQRLLLSAAYALAPRLRKAIRRQAQPAWTRQSWFDDRLETTDGERAAVGANPMQRLIQEQLASSVIPSSLLLEGCNSNAHGLENRLPYLVPSMIRMAGAMPSEYLVSNTGEAKSVLRHALRGMVPSDILDRRDRVGFAVPALPWLTELEPWVLDQLRELRSLPFYQEARRSGMPRNTRGADRPTGHDAFNTWRWIALLEWSKANEVGFR